MPTSFSSADAQYDVAVEAMMADIQSKLKKNRPADPTAFLKSLLLKGNFEFPEPDVCRLIKDQYPPSLSLNPITIVVFGASGDLAKKKTFPALFGLYCNGLLPRFSAPSDSGHRRPILSIIGFARTRYAQKEFHDHLRPLLEKSITASTPQYRRHIDGFLSFVRYVQGDSYSDAAGFGRLSNVIAFHEKKASGGGEGEGEGEGAEGGAIVTAAAGGGAAASASVAEVCGGCGGPMPTTLPMDDDAFKAIEGTTTGNASSASPYLQAGNRLFYLALPPTAFIDTCTAIKAHLVGANITGEATTHPRQLWARVVVEKPFGHDTKSSNALADSLNKLFTESQIFRIDHYLGKEMVQNVVSLRFANHVFSAVWSRQNIACVQIVFKEKIGTEGRGGYFDSFGIIRDVIQNHLCQILALVAMEKPRTLSAEDVRDEKVALLRCVEPVAVGDVVLGQYTRNAEMKGYKEDEGVPTDSKTPTFAIMKLRINNDRWDGVPFILKAGKAMEDKCVTVRVQFKDELRPYGVVPNDADADEDGGDASRAARIIPPNRNELVIRAQPDEAMYLKINTKSPGMGAGVLPTPSAGAGGGGGDAADAPPSSPSQQQQQLTLTELDLTYNKRFNVRIPEAYESLVNEAILGNSTNFVRRDELDASWRIFTPLLHAIDKGQVPVREYVAGTRGPAEAEDLIASTGYRRSRDYFYAPSSPKK